MLAEKKKKKVSQVHTLLSSRTISPYATGRYEFFQDWNCLAALKKLKRMIRITTAGLRKSMGLASRLKNHLLSIEKEIPNGVLVVFSLRASRFSEVMDLNLHAAVFTFLQVGLCDSGFKRGRNFSLEDCTKDWGHTAM